MSVRRHVVVPGVDDALVAHLDLEHGRAQHVAGVVRLDLQLVIVLDHLMRENRTCRRILYLFLCDVNCT